MQILIKVDEARRLILDKVSAVTVEEIAVADALGRTLAESVVSPETIPPFPNSAMDGFAVRSADLDPVPARLTIMGEIPAGTVASVEVTEGTCLQIMTGAPMPVGADAVAPVEWTKVEGDVVIIDKQPAKGQHVRAAGRDVKAGDEVLPAGHRITPPMIGMLAAVGRDRVVVSRWPSVAIIATGDELVGPGEPLGPGQIRNSSGPGLMAQVIAAGGMPIPPILARDNEESIRAAIRSALAADVLVFSGGVSVGDYDLVKQVLDDEGLEMGFWKVKQRPGKPLAFGVLQGKPVFGLPGNPVSSAMCFEQYVRPALAKMLGRQTIQQPRHRAVLLEETRKVAGLHFFARGFAEFNEDGRLVVRDTGPQASNIYSSVVQANCIIHVAEGLAEAPAGTEVEIEWLGW